MPGQSYRCLCVPGYSGKTCETNINDCVNHKCQHKSQCVDHLNNYTCSCLAGYGGTFCENIVDACFSQPCKNQGRCTYIGLCTCLDVVFRTCGWHDENCQKRECQKRPSCQLNPRSYKCNCTGTGFEGEVCDKDINECGNSGLCLNGGRCINLAGTWRCDCTGTGYNGSRCQQDVQECGSGDQETSLCNDQGQCVNYPGSYGCVCNSEWTGRNCREKIDHCVSKPCVNNAVCVDGLGTFRCDCLPGFTGKTCSENVNECTEKIPKCQNNATCTDTVGSYVCQCLDKYTGLHCETATNGPDKMALSQQNSSVIIAVVMIILLLVAIICVLYALWYIQRSRKMKGKYNPSEAERDSGKPIPLEKILAEDLDERLI